MSNGGSTNKTFIRNEFSTFSTPANICAPQTYEDKKHRLHYRGKRVDLSTRPGRDAVLRVRGSNLEPKSHNIPTREGRGPPRPSSHDESPSHKIRTRRSASLPKGTVRMLP